MPEPLARKKLLLVQLLGLVATPSSMKRGSGGQFVLQSACGSLVSFSSPRTSFFTFFISQMGVVDRLHMRSAIEALLAFAALAGKELRIKKSWA